MFIEYQEKTKSTQQLAKDFIKNNKITQNISIFISKEQTAGTGRNGKIWISPKGNFYASIVFADNFVNNEIILPFITAIAVDEALEITSCTQYKCPNDILINSQKVAGILIEKLPNYIIIGIGINLTSSPAILQYKTTNLKAENLLNFEINEQTLIKLAEKIVNKIIKWDNKSAIKEWNKKAYNKNLDIEIKLPNGKIINGIFKEVDSFGKMVIESNKEIIKLSYGEF